MSVTKYDLWSLLLKMQARLKLMIVKSQGEPHPGHHPSGDIPITLHLISQDITFRDPPDPPSGDIPITSHLISQGITFKDPPGFTPRVIYPAPDT